MLDVELCQIVSSPSDHYFTSWPLGQQDTPACKAHISRMEKSDISFFLVKATETAAFMCEDLFHIRVLIHSSATSRLTGFVSNLCQSDVASSQPLNWLF